MNLIDKIYFKIRTEKAKENEPSIVLMHPETHRFASKLIQSQVEYSQHVNKGEFKEVFGLRIIRSLDLKSDEIIVK